MVQRNESQHYLQKMNHNMSSSTIISESSDIFPLGCCDHSSLWNFHTHTHTHTHMCLLRDTNFMTSECLRLQTHTYIHSLKPWRPTSSTFIGCKVLIITRCVITSVTAYAIFLSSKRFTHRNWVLIKRPYQRPSRQSVCSMPILLSKLRWSTRWSWWPSAA